MWYVDMKVFDVVLYGNFQIRMVGFYYVFKILGVMVIVQSRIYIDVIESSDIRLEVKVIIRIKRVIIVKVCVFSYLCFL